ncbi:MAG: hypothetical protein PWQ96_1638 [Clostridia bacterium]|nr:hypothetical protein [Clostridia bacterium]
MLAWNLIIQSFVLILIIVSVGQLITKMVEKKGD